jgi:hypothetical protein
MGIGSRLKVGIGEDVYYGYTRSGEGYMNQNSSAEFFGLGDAITVDYIEVYWLSGMADRIEDIDPNQTITILEGSNPLSTEEFTTNEMTVYPNPATNTIHFTYSGNQHTLDVTIIDIHGKVLKRQQINNTNQEHSIDLSNLAGGIYFLSMNDTDKTIVKKIIVL